MAQADERAGTLISGGRVRTEAKKEDDLAQVRDAVGTLLQVNHVAVLIGSGASLHLGSPDIRNVTAETLKDLAISVGMPMKDSALELASATATDQGMDLEQMLGSLSAATSYSEALGSSHVDIRGTSFSLSSVRSLRADVNAVLAAACDLPRSTSHQELPADHLMAHRAFLKRLLGARRESTPPVQIFTTNYDLLIEKALDEAGIQFIDGFAGVYRRTFEPSMYDLQLHRQSGEGRPTRLNDLVYLYKLHGSINWRVETTGRQDLVVSMGSSAPAPDGKLALIYPTPHKEGEVLGFPYSDLMRAFGDALKQPETTLLVAGYGFGDNHINRILFQSLDFNPTLQMLVVEPFGLSEVMAGTEEPNSVVSRLAVSKDARCTLITGPVAKFAQLWRCFPTHASDSAEATAEVPAPPLLRTLTKGDSDA